VGLDFIEEIARVCEEQHFRRIARINLSPALYSRLIDDMNSRLPFFFNDRSFEKSRSGADVSMTIMILGGSVEVFYIFTLDGFTFEFTPEGNYDASND